MTKSNLHLTVEHKLRLLDDLPDADGAVPAAGGHRPLPDAGVDARDPVLVPKEGLDVRHLVHVPHLDRPVVRAAEQSPAEGSLVKFWQMIGSGSIQIIGQLVHISHIWSIG